MAEKHANYYPKQVIKNNNNPNLLFAFPFVGIIIKCILIIPVGIWIVILSFAYLFLNLIVPFYILFTGKYWDTAYHFNLGFMRLNTKAVLYIAGLLDKYPGFSMDDGGFFELHFEKPTKVNRWLSFPIFGFVIRVILLIPFLIWESILYYGSQVAVFASWFAILFKRKYPESFYEFVVDYIRISNASTIYTSYMSDTYPSFHIAKTHRNAKIVLIVLGTILMLADFKTQVDDMNKTPNYDNYNNYQNSPQYLPES